MGTTTAAVEHWWKTDRTFAAAVLIFAGSIFLAGAALLAARLAPEDAPPDSVLTVTVCNPATHIAGPPLDPAFADRLDPHEPDRRCDPAITTTPITIAGWDAATTRAGQVCSTARATYRVTVRMLPVFDGDAPTHDFVDTEITYPAGCIQPYVGNQWPMPDEVATYVRTNGNTHYRVVGFAESLTGSVGSYGWDAIGTVEVTP